VCEICKNTYFLDGQLKSCTQTCPIKFFNFKEDPTDLTEGGVCSACGDGCDICDDENTCTTCTPNELFELSDDGKCLAPKSEQECGELVEFCSTCDIYGVCEVCMLGYTLSESNGIQECTNNS
jgi:hypothetical protein